MKDKKIIVDSSFLVSLFIPEDTNHKKAAKTMDEMENEDFTFYIPQRVIEETATVLTYKKGKNVANKFLDFIFEFQFKNIVVIQNNFSQEINYFHKHTSHKISFIDASIIYQSSILNIPILTYDKQMNRIFGS